MMQRQTLFISALTLSIGLVAAQSSEQSDSLARELQEVVVTANQPATRLVGTTLVSTIAGTALQELGTALDVLNQLPLIQVTDNAVTVIGQGVPEIYIDGRPLRSDDELTLLQSSDIRNVELLMAPGAMYASDTRAVLKITTRRKFIAGLSLTDRAEASVRRKVSLNDMLDLNYRVGSWDIFASGIIARNDGLLKGTTTNTLTYDDREITIGSSQNKCYPSTNGVVKAGVNYSSGAHSFGAYYRYNPERGNFSNSGEEWLDDAPPIRRDIFTGIRAHSHLTSVYYDNTFRGKYPVHFDGDYRNSHAANTIETAYPDGDAADVKSADSRKSTLIAGKLYLSFPFAKGNITVGTQDSYTRTSLNFTMFSPEVSSYIPSSFTDARQISLSTFASWDRMFGNLSLSAGLRYEYTDYLFKENGVTNVDMSSTDNYLTPDISIGYSFNDNSQVSLSYKMVTSRPPYAQLTGSLSYVGIHEIEGGNPALKEERMHDLRFFGMWKSFMLQADCSRSSNSYAYIKRIYPAQTLQLLMQPVNIDVSALSLYLIWSQQIKVWTPSLTAGMYKQWLKLYGTSYNRPIFAYYFDNTIALPRDVILTLNASGQTCGDIHTNRFGTTRFSLDASLSKSFFNNSLQLKLSASDIFNTRNNNWTMKTCGIIVDKRQTYDYRGVTFSLTYRFQPQKSKYKGNAASETEMNRL